MKENTVRCVKSIRNVCDMVPQVAIVLGSGLGAFADSLDSLTASISYHDIDGFPVSTVPGHTGRFVFGYMGKTPVVILQGRVHYYEGYSMEQVTLPIRILKQIGVQSVILTNAAGSIDPTFAPGDLMLIEDHIASFVPSALRGANDDALGPRFPDMTHVYDTRMAQTFQQEADKMGLALRKGIYLQTPGPQYETRAEVRMYELLGASAVGMSTACEAIVAKHSGMSVAGISCISNQAAGISANPLSHEEVMVSTAKAASGFAMLLKNTVLALGEEESFHD